MVRAALARARAAFPRIAMSDAAFTARLEDLCRREPRVEHRFDKVNIQDLFLAFACLEGDAAALGELDASYLKKAPAYVRRYLPDEAAVADVVQELGRRMLGYGEQAGPKLALYSGLGPLGAFVRVAAVRLAQTARRTTTRKREDEIGDEIVAATTPELLVLRRQYATELGLALRAALSSLARDERDMLRLHYYDGMSLEELAAAYKTSRATAARRLAAARATIIDAASAHLRKSLGPNAPDVASLFGFVKSDLDLGLSKILAKSGV
jgi:RNA polymerase sigma-70 factor (ECF subfamily)